MAVDFREIFDAVEDMLSRTDLRDQIRRETGNVIESLNRSTFYPLQFRGATISVAPGTIWYTEIDLSTGAGYIDGSTRSTQDVQRIEYMRRENEQDPGMMFLHYTEFERRQEGPTIAGFPTWYTLHSGQIGIWPSPSVAETLYFSGWIKSSERDDWAEGSPNSTETWFQEARELMEVSTARRVASKYLHDAELAALFVPDERRLTSELMAESNRRQTTRRIKSHGL